MKINPRKLLPEDFQDQTGWIEKLLNPINLYFQESYSAFSNNLTVEDNLYREIKEFRINNYDSSILPIRIKTKFSAQPKGLNIIYCVNNNGSNISSTPFLNWTYSNNQLLINSIVGVTNGESYTIRIEIIYG